MERVKGGLKEEVRVRVDYEIFESTSLDHDLVLFVRWH